MKVLFFGLGGIGQRHLRNLLKIDRDSSIGAVRKCLRVFEIGDDLKPDHSVNIIKKYGIDVFTTLEKAMSFRPDFAIVANPTSEHIKTASALVKRGIPVFLEKPVSDNRKGLAELERLSREKKVPVMAGYMMRFHPCAAKMKSLITNGKVGRIQSVAVTAHSYMPLWHTYEKCNDFYAGKRSLGGGVVLTEIHEIDLLFWFFGVPKKLFAVGGKLSDLPIDVEDTASILMEQRYMGRTFPVSVNLSFVQRPPIRKMAIFGSNGRIEWDISASIITIASAGSGTKKIYDRSDFSRNDMFVSELRHFIRCIMRNKEPLTSLRAVMDGHLTALAIKKEIKV